MIEISLIGLLLIATVFVIILVIANIKFNSKDKADKHDDSPSINISDSPKNTVNIDLPILTTHASMRMNERLGITGNQQIELMHNAFKYGRTADRTSGDLRAKLEAVEISYSDEVVAKYYKNLVFIFTAEENILKTVYFFDNYYN